MTQDEIIEMAIQAGFVDYELDDGTTNAFDKRYEAFANLVAEREREACAKVADSHMDGTPEWNSAANNIAAAIRARGNYQKGQTD